MPVTNENCVCDPQVPPPACEVPVQVPITPEPQNIKDFEIRDACSPCKPETEACLPVVPDVPPLPVCKIVDPLYCLYRGQNCEGQFNLYIAISPTEALIQKKQPECREQPCSLIDFNEWVRGDGLYTWRALGSTAENPLTFYVSRQYEKRVNCEPGYVLVGRSNECNEWFPLECIQDSHLLPQVTVYTGSRGGLTTSDPNAVLIGLDKCGTLPWVYSAPTVTNPGDQNDAQNVAITDLQLTANQAIETWSAAPLPTGLTLDPATGIISGTPTVVEAPVVTVTATNFFGVTSEPITFTWTIS